MTTKKDDGQHARFIETARKLECDEDEVRFKEKMGKMGKSKPAAEGPKVPK